MQAQSAELEHVEDLGWQLVERADGDSDSIPPQLWKAPWRMRVLRTLGLDRFWTPSNQEPQAVVADPVQDIDEEELLSEQLVLAVLNAEKQAASSQLNSCPQTETRLPDVKTPDPKSKNSRKTSNLQFSDDSQICFFELEDYGFRIQATSECYQCGLQTKEFDGPSGHKAKRRRKSNEEASSSEASCSDSEEDDWEDKCDAIAELMSRPRTMVLWSQSW